MSKKSKQPSNNPFGIQIQGLENITQNIADLRDVMTLLIVGEVSTISDKVDIIHSRILHCSLFFIFTQYEPKHARTSWMQCTSNFLLGR